MAGTDIVIKAEPLTTENFAAFGEVIVHKREDRLQTIDQVFAADGQGIRPSLALIWIASPGGSPVTVEKLERHPHSAQGFLPLQNGRCLVVACASMPDGSPDFSTIRAFVSAAGEGVLYGRNVWHKGITPIEDDAHFAMAMMKTDGGADTEFATLQPVVQVEVS